MSQARKVAKSELVMPINQTFENQLLSSMTSQILRQVAFDDFFLFGFGEGKKMIERRFNDCRVRLIKFFASFAKLVEEFKMEFKTF